MKSVPATEIQRQLRLTSRQFRRLVASRQLPVIEGRVSQQAYAEFLQRHRVTGRRTTE